MNRQSAIILFAACVIVAGCADVARTYSASDPRMKLDGYYNDGAADRDLRLVVIGDPFGMPGDAFKHIVEADLSSESVLGRPPTRPTLTPGPSAKPLYRLVYAFDAPNALYGNTLCQLSENDIKSSPHEGKVVATAAFCVGGRAESYIWGDTIADGPNDQRLYSLAREMMDGVLRPDVRQEASPPPVRSP